MNEYIYKHEMDLYKNDTTNHECRDYLSTDKILYMNILKDYNDLEWKIEAPNVLKQVIIENEDGDQVLNEPKEIFSYNSNIKE